MVAQLVAATKILAVEAGTSVDPTCLPCQSTPALFVAATSPL